MAIIQPPDPVVQEAINLAEKLRRYCTEHDLDREYVLNGVAWDHNYILRKQHEKVRDAKKRIVEILKQLV